MAGAANQYGPAAWVSTRASAWSVLRRYGNINPSSIDYACRPRLRSRLTQSGLAWPWNPWSLGARASHPSHRYSCLHSHSRTVHQQSPTGFPRCRTLPYHPQPLPPPQQVGQRKEPCHGSAASAVCLSPATLSAHDHSTSELLRTLSRMAASKPTSWLSARPHILSHLAHA